MAFDDVCNSCHFIGWVTAEPEHGQTGDLQWCNFSIGIAGGKKGGEREYAKISAYYDTAERVKKIVGKGSQIDLLGKKATKKWETKTGEKRESTYFILSSFFCGDAVSAGRKSNEEENKTLEQAFGDLPFNT